MKNTAIIILLMLLNTVLHARSPSTAIELGGSIGVVSSYVFRGVKFNDLSLQGTVALSSPLVDGLSVGFWFASLDDSFDQRLTNDQPNTETDYFIRYLLQSSSSFIEFGWTGHSFDFERFKEKAGVEHELSVNGGYEWLMFEVAITPPQRSTRETEAREPDDEGGPFYWAGLGAFYDKGEYFMQASYVGGNWSSRGGLEADSEEVSGVQYGVGKVVNETWQVEFQWFSPVKKGQKVNLESLFWVGGANTF